MKRSCASTGISLHGICCQLISIGLVERLVDKQQKLIGVNGQHDVVGRVLDLDWTQISNSNLKLCPQHETSHYKN